MKVLYVITQAELGGAQTYVLSLAEHFSGDIAVGPGSEELTALAKRRGITVHALAHLRREVSPIHDLAAVFEIARLAGRLKPDLVHVNSSKAGVLGSLARLLHRVPTIYTAHGFVFHEPLPAPTRWFYKMMETLAGRLRDYTITVSDADRRSAVEMLGLKPELVTTVHNGIPGIDFLERTAARERLGIPAGQVAFVTVAHFYKTKGLDVLVEAAAKVAKETEVHWYLIGDGELKGELERQITRLDLKDRVHLLGRILKARDYLKAFDAAVLPSRKEGFPYAVLEALQAELPTVATDVGGIPEAVSGAGTLVPPEDPQRLAEVMRTLNELFAPERAGELREQKQRAGERAKQFTLERMLQETESVYRKILEKKSP